VVLGSARDVVEHCGVARFLFVDFPLGNPCGKPGDRTMQAAIVRQALDLFYTARESRTTVLAPYRWSENESWRDSFCRVDDSNRELLFAKGEERRRRQQEARTAGSQRSPMIDY
jgi:D-proline reductase (dithiol) PrdB